MTTPKINTIKRGDARLYVHPETAEKVPGVTSILNMLPKPFLRYWAAKKVAQAAVDTLGEVVGIAMKAGPDAAVDYLKRAPDRDTHQAADSGTAVHELFEQLASGNEPGRIHPDLRPYVALFRGFVEQYEVEFRMLEGTVWSETHKYAGSFDFIADVTDPDTHERLTVIGDWKTTRSGVHEEVSLQLAAYGHADYIVTPEGEKQDIPHLDAGIVVHVRPEGGEVVPARIDDEVFSWFLTLRRVFDYEKEGKKTVLGRPDAIKPAESKPKRGGRK